MLDFMLKHTVSEKGEEVNKDVWLVTESSLKRDLKGEVWIDKKEERHYVKGENMKEDLEGEMGMCVCRMVKGGCSLGFADIVEWGMSNMMKEGSV